MAVMASKSGSSEALTGRILADLGRIQIASDHPRLSTDEERVLALYDQIQDIRLRSAIAKAAPDVSSMQTFNLRQNCQGAYWDLASKLTGDDLTQELKKWERDMLEARAVYLLQNHIVDDVLMLNPVLKAVHADTFDGSRERELRDQINQRDVLSLTHGNITASLHDTQNQLVEVQTASIKTVEENQKLAHDVRTLAGLLKHKDPENVIDEDLRARLQSAQAELDRAKKRRRLIKGVVSAIVAGSGVDWSQDERLLKLVLDEG